MKRKRNIFATMTAWDPENTGGQGGGQGAGQGGGEGAGAGQGAPPPAAINEDRVRSIVTDAIKGVRADFTKSVSESVAPITSQLEAFAEVLKALQPAQQHASPRGENNPDPQLTARLLDTEKTSKALQQQVERLQKENEEARKEAERADRHGRIRSSLNQFQFVSDDAAETAFNLMEREIRRDPETGNLIAGPEGRVLPFDVYAKETLNSKHAYLLGVKQSAGAGASRGDVSKYTANAGNNNMVGTTEMIRPGMRKEERDAVIAQIAHVASQMGR